ncbi:MAG TPA: hypothetical protein VFX06_13250 [Stellaceae bacterium]|nr:hypothetical protein [Stellaceae bacterium]
MNRSRRRPVWYLGPAAVALLGFAGVALPAAPAAAQSKNVVNCFDVEPNYHSNLLSDPECLGYWNQGLVRPAYDYPYYGYGYGYYGYRYPYAPYRR